MKYRILIVDDSSFARQITREMLSTDLEMEVAGEAEDGYMAVKMVQELNPDAVVLDLIMPHPDGLWTVENILKVKKVPIVIFSAVTAENAEITTEAFRYGIVDVIRKPDHPGAIRLCREELVAKVKSAAKTKSVLQMLLSGRELPPSPHPSFQRAAKSAIAIVASAGSPAVLMEFLKNLGEKCQQFEKMDIAVMVALHLPNEFLNSYTGTVAAVTPCRVRVAKQGEVFRRKNIYFSPGNSTLLFKRTRVGIVGKLEKLKMKLQPDFNSFLKSCSGAFGKKMIAIIFSGMGEHGLEGAATVQRAGGKVIAQEPSTAGVSAMPQAVINAGICDAVLEPSKMTEKILTLL